MKPKYSMAYRMFLAAARKHAKARAAADKAATASNFIWGALSTQEREAWLRDHLDDTCRR